MGVFSRIFGSRPKSKAKPEVTSAALAWTGTDYDIRVTRGSEHQRELEELFNDFNSGNFFKPGRIEMVCVAGLVREPNDAVRVEIKDRTVGYLSQVEAAEYCRRMRAMGKGDEIVGVSMAMIANDGFDPKERFVLNLDLKWPVEELPT